MKTRVTVYLSNGDKISGLMNGNYKEVRKILDGHVTNPDENFPKEIKLDDEQEGEISIPFDFFSKNIYYIEKYGVVD